MKFIIFSTEVRNNDLLMGDRTKTHRGALYFVQEQDALLACLALGSNLTKFTKRVKMPGDILQLLPNSNQRNDQ